MDEQQCICHSNVKARQLLERSSLLWPDQYNRLKVLTGFQDKLNELVHSALFQSAVSHSGELGGVLGIYDSAQGKSLMLTVAPLSSIDYAHQMAQQQRIAIFITESSCRHQLAEEFVKQRFGLTKRELQICELFLNGLNLEEIAEHCSISLQSVRTYLKHIFSKTSCSSQAELMRLLMGCTMNFEHIV